MDGLELPLISVLMPCHNAAPYVGEAVASVLAQTYPHVELVIVDDGSTDGASDVLQGLAAAHPERITLVYQNRAGPWAARNHALARAHGAFIAFLDADDTWAPEALARLHAALDAARADIACCGWQSMGVGVTAPQPHPPPAADAAGALDHAFEHGAWPLNALLIHRPRLDALHGFSERLPTAMDFDLWLRLLADAPVLAAVPEALAQRRRYPRDDARIPQWQQVSDAVAVRRDFARHHPDAVAHYTPFRLDELIYAPLLREAYRCHWRHDTESARRLFRRAFRTAGWQAGDLKHLVASLLPAPLYRGVVDLVTWRRRTRFEG
jgi:glycosyltransferase involved in cell wall biosynthesis